MLAIFKPENNSEWLNRIWKTIKNSRKTTVFQSLQSDLELSWEMTWHALSETFAEEREFLGSREKIGKNQLIKVPKYKFWVRNFDFFYIFRIFAICFSFSRRDLFVGHKTSF